MATIKVFPAVIHILRNPLAGTPSASKLNPCRCRSRQQLDLLVSVKDYLNLLSSCLPGGSKKLGLLIYHVILCIKIQFVPFFFPSSSTFLVFFVSASVFFA